MAASIASDGGAEPNVDPAVRIAIEDLARVAELHVEQAVGVTLPSDTKVTAVTRSVWTGQSVTAYRPFFERFGEALSAGIQSGSSELESTEDLGLDPDDPLAGLFPAHIMGQLFATLGPMLVATSAGAMLGHLGQQALGQYELPVPRSTSEILVVPANIDTAAGEWDVPVNDLRLWLLIHELVAHSVLSVPHVKARLDALFIDFAAAFRPDPEAIGEKFGAVTDMAEMQQMAETMSDPDVVLSLMRSPAHDLLVPQVDAMVAAVLGFVGHTVRTISDGLIRAAPIIEDRMKERLIDVAPADRFMERLLGLEIDENTLSRGDEFIGGVVARAGDEGLRRLWSDELDIPTAAEVDAPGLWLARIGLDDDASKLDLEIPDDLSGLEDL